MLGITLWWSRSLWPVVDSSVMTPIIPSGLWLYAFVRTSPRKQCRSWSNSSCLQKTLQSFPTVSSNCALAPPMQKGLKSCNWAVSLKNKQGKCTLGLCLQNCLYVHVCGGLCEQEGNSFPCLCELGKLNASLTWNLPMSFLFCFAVFSGTAHAVCKIIKVGMCLKDIDCSSGSCRFNSS